MTRTFISRGRCTGSIIDPIRGKKGIRPKKDIGKPSVAVDPNGAPVEDLTQAEVEMRGESMPA
jgi:hypothetical protein